MKRVGVLPFEEVHVPQRRRRLLAGLGQDGAETAETARAYDRGVVPFRLPHNTCSLDAGPHTAGLQCGGAEVRREKVTVKLDATSYFNVHISLH